MFARAASCATGNSVPPRFPRHGREAGKIACRGSTIRGEGDGDVGEEERKGQRKEGGSQTDAHDFVLRTE